MKYFRNISSKTKSWKEVRDPVLRRETDHNFVRSFPGIVYYFWKGYYESEDI
jgi:hypothetical protein